MTWAKVTDPPANWLMPMMAASAMSAAAASFVSLLCIAILHIFGCVCADCVRLYSSLADKAALRIFSSSCSVVLAEEFLSVQMALVSLSIFSEFSMIPPCHSTVNEVAPIRSGTCSGLYLVRHFATQQFL